MAVVIKPKRSGGVGLAPALGDLADGEIAVNYTDKKYYMRVGGAVVDITPGAGSYVSTGGAFADAFSSTVLYYNGTGGGNNIDVNTLVEGVKALVNPSGGNTNYPPALAATAPAFWHIETIRGYTSGTRIQKAYGYGTRGAYATRSYNGTTWTEWEFMDWGSNASKLQADFSTAAAASRAYFQSKTTNGFTAIGAVPNGTSGISLFRAYNNSNLTNAAYIDIYAGPTFMNINVGAEGTGTVYDLGFTFGGVRKAYLEASSGRFYADGIRVDQNSLGSYLLADRTTTDLFGWYASGGIMRLWHNTGGDRITMDTAGNVAIDGTLAIENGKVAGWKHLYSAANTWVQGGLNKMTAGLSIGTGNVADTTYYGYNNSAANITLTPLAGLTLRKSGTATTGAIQVLPRGFFMLYCLSTTEYILSGDLV